MKPTDAQIAAVSRAIAKAIEETGDWSKAAEAALAAAEMESGDPTPTDAQIKRALRHALMFASGIKLRSAGEKAARENLVAELNRLMPVFSTTDTWNSGDITYNSTKINVTDQLDGPPLKDKP